MLDVWRKYKCGTCDAEFPCIIVDRVPGEIADEEPEYCMMCGSDDVEEVGSVKV